VSPPDNKWKRIDVLFPPEMIEEMKTRIDGIEFESQSQLIRLAVRHLLNEMHVCDKHGTVFVMAKRYRGEGES